MGRESLGERALCSLVPAVAKPPFRILAREEAGRRCESRKSLTARLNFPGREGTKGNPGVVTIGFSYHHSLLIANCNHTCICIVSS